MALRTGREIGRVNVRVVPNTKHFRRDLYDKLDKDLRELRGTATIDKVRVDREKVRQSLDRELEKIKPAPIKVDNVRVRVNRVQVDRKAIAKSVRDELDKMNARVRIHARVANAQEFINEVQRMIRRAEEHDFKLKPQKLRVKTSLDQKSLNDMRDRLDSVLGDEHEDTKGRILKFLPQLSDKEREKFKYQVDRLIEEHDGDSITLGVDLDNLVAQASLRWMTRDRFVNVFVRVSKASLATAAAELAKLAAAGSGGRLAFKWLEDIVDMFKELDRNAPLFISVTAALVSAFAAITSAGQGLIGIGGDLARIGPAMLVIPGLILNGISSVVTMIVALRNAKTELAALSDDMTELGEIINTAFWDQARDPIVNMTESLMPQLRNALKDTADATGRFMGEMASALQRHLGGGRLESIFDGINESWQILADGADGFAGALVNLSEIGARYMPGLAKWFSDLAADFSDWLTKISTSDQLDTWIKNAVFEMNELWRATKNAWGFLQALYDAANAAGGTGLTGLADMLGAWREVANTEKFQRGLIAVFEGSMGAMRAFGDAIKAIGNLIGDNDRAFRHFIESAGGFLAGLIEGISNALNSPKVMTGLNAFSDGLVEGIGKIVKGLDPFADTFGSFLSLMGDLASDLLPSAVKALGNFMPVIDTILGHLSDSDLLDTLGDALVGITEALAPGLIAVADALTPTLISALEWFAEAAEALAPELGEAASSISSYMAEIADSADGTWAEDLANGIVSALETALGSFAAGFHGLVNFEDLFTDPQGFIDGFKKKIESVGGPFEKVFNFLEDKLGGLGRILSRWAIMWTEAYLTVRQKVRQIAQFLSDKWDEIKTTFETWGATLETTFKTFWNGLVGFVEDPLGRLGEMIRSLLHAIRTGDWEPFWETLTNSGREGGEKAGKQSGSALAKGIEDSRPKVKEAQGKTRKGMVDAFDGVGRQFNTVGKKVPDGLADGIRASAGRAGSAAATMRDGSVLSKFDGIGKSMGTAGRKVPGGLADGIRANALSAGNAAATMRDGSVLAKFDGIGKMAGSAGRKVPGGIADGIRGNALSAGNAAAVMRDGSVLSKFKGIGKKVRGFGSEVPGSLGMGINNNAWRARGGAQAVVDTMAAALERLVSIAGTIGARMAQAIRDWVNSALGWANDQTGKSHGGPSSRLSTYSTLSTEALRVQRADEPSVGLAAMSATSTFQAAKTAREDISAQAYQVDSWRRDQVSRRPASGFGPAPIAQTGARVEVTMPMLPGETPAEQRDNVVRELRDVFA